MAIKLKLKSSIPRKAGGLCAIPRKAETPEDLETFKKTVFNRWQAGVKKGDGALSTHVVPEYYDACEHGFRGHMGQWVDAVLEAGGMSMDDFPPAYPNDPRPDKWPNGKPKTLAELRGSNL